MIFSVILYLLSLIILKRCTYKIEKKRINFFIVSLLQVFLIFLLFYEIKHNAYDITLETFSSIFNQSQFYIILFYQFTVAHEVGQFSIMMCEWLVTTSPLSLTTPKRSAVFNGPLTVNCWQAVPMTTP